MSENNENDEIEEYVVSRKAKKILGVHLLTLQSWDKKGKIDTIRTAGNHRLYNVKKYLRENTRKKSSRENTQDSQKSKSSKISNRESRESSDTLDSVESDSDNTFDDEMMKRNIYYFRTFEKLKKTEMQKLKEIVDETYPNYEVLFDVGNIFDVDSITFKNLIKSIKTINKLVMHDTGTVSISIYNLLKFLIGSENISYNEQNENHCEQDVMKVINSIMALVNYKN